MNTPMARHKMRDIWMSSTTSRDTVYAVDMSASVLIQPKDN